MSKIMYAAIFSIVVLMFGTIASVILIPDASALQSRGHWLKDIGTWHKNRAPSKICGDQLCDSINSASIGLRKAQIDRGFPR